MTTTYRVEELAAEAGVSVEVLRSYQSKGLLPPPRHEGRVALYGTTHLDRLKRIRDLKARGHSLRAIASMLSEEPSAMPRLPDAVLVAGDTLSLVDLADRTRVPPAVLRSLEASGIIRPDTTTGEPRFTSADVRAVKMLLSLIGGGVPMEQFMDVARVQLAANETIAQGAVDLFLRYVREPLLTSHLSQKEEASRLVASFRLMLQAVSELMAYNFQRIALETLSKELAEQGSRSERAALRRDTARRRPDVA
ncbi:MAG TPA: MerR family transcriptional regulator [Acidimicrobiales bacterium]|nr:MerR family transcriptional regulator [Acidimicrobiales bacterium]